ncbi:MAG: leucine-rich repeat domain-containing protein [Bacteroidetes bacterium]|nr:leucine-rich repeat domain-containing protein [Bacteroidota bacterium]
MKQFLIVILLLFSGLSLYSQASQRSADEIKKEMAQIRRSTDWGSEEESKKADVKIQELTKELMMVNKAKQQQQSGAPADTAKIREEVDYKMKVWDQMMKSVAQGEGGDILLGTPMREEIVEAYKDDESPKIKNKEYVDEITFLSIDMSLPTVQRTIEQMERFKSIKFLVITGGKHGAPVNLDDLLTRASKYPLEKLYIINFQNFVTSVPDKLAVFNSLKTLALFNNKIAQLPGEISHLTSLKELYVDMNPVMTLFPMINSLSKLDTLGIVKTQVPESEVHLIETLLPNCKILTQ